jgi:hypothetical protein
VSKTLRIRMAWSLHSSVWDAPQSQVHPPPLVAPAEASAYFYYIFCNSTEPGLSVHSRLILVPTCSGFGHDS